MPKFRLITLFYAQLVLISIALSPVLGQKRSNATHIGYDPELQITCVLSAFKASVSVKPFNKTFVGNTFADIRPETANFNLTKCKDEAIEHYFRYDDYNQTDRESLLSFGFELGSGLPIEVHIKYLEVLCNRPNGCLRQDSQYCKDDEKKCLRMASSYTLAWVKKGYAYQCSHNSLWTKNLKVTVYVKEMPTFLGSFGFNLDYIRIGTTNNSNTFNPSTHCWMDWLFDTNTIIIVTVVIIIFISGIFCKCLLECKNKRNKRSKDLKKEVRKSSSVRTEKYNKQEMEECGQPIEL